MLTMTALFGSAGDGKRLFANPRSERVVLVCAVMLLAVPLLVATTAAGEDLRVGTLVMGRGWWMPRVTIDPLLEVTNVPATRYDLADEEIRRFMRLYMPRTYAAMLEQFNVLYLANTGVRNYETEWLEWFTRGVAEEGLGLLMTGGSESFGARGSDTSWGTTPVGDVLPVTTQWVISDNHYHIAFKLDIVDPQNALIASLPWQDAPAFYYMNLDCRPKAGSTVLGYGELPGYPRRLHPVFAEWAYGEGRSLAVTPDITVGPAEDFLRWEYWPDLMINLITYTSGEKLSPEYEVVHNLRLSLGAYHTRRNAAISLMDFADKFGASLRAPEVALERASDELSKVTELYMEGRIGDAADTMDQVLQSLTEAEDLAVKARNNAMRWVFLIEWLTVTGTFLLSGVTLYSLLIRRRAYREVGLTRTRR